MKLSALVFRRQGYNFHIESTGFRWTFTYQKERFACVLSRFPENTLQELRKKAQGSQRTTESHPWEDVCFVVGAPGPSRNITGTSIPGTRITVSNFKKWLQVTLDINPLQQMIRTSQGDLIRDPNYKGRSYLKGLLLNSGGVSSSYSKGYNFRYGTTNRDRESMSNLKEENMRIDAIWFAAIREDKSSGSDVLVEYTNLLVDPYNETGDTMFSRDRKDFPKDIAAKIWIQMRVIDRGNDGRWAFYYPSNEDESVRHIIEAGFKMHPKSISPGPWKMLRQHELCQTTEEGLNHRFKAAKLVSVSDTCFAEHVSWMLKQLLLNSPETEDMKLTYVAGDSLTMDAAFFDNTWRIHNKWLTHEGSHADIYCDALDTSENATFKCDNVVLQLWDIMIEHLGSTKEHAELGLRGPYLRSMAYSRMRQMPRSVRCTQTYKQGQLHVFWNSGDTRENDQKPVKIVLHSSACKTRLGMKVCGDACPSKPSQAFSNGVIFSGLDSTRSYGAYVKRDAEGAFTAPPSSWVRSRAVDATAPQSPTKPQNESYVLGDSISPSVLTRNTDFPISFDFHRARNDPKEDVFIVKRKHESARVKSEVSLSAVGALLMGLCDGT